MKRIEELEDGELRKRVIPILEQADRKKYVPLLCIGIVILWGVFSYLSDGFRGQFSGSFMLVVGAGMFHQFREVKLLREFIRRGLKDPTIFDFGSWKSGSYGNDNP